MKRAITRHRCDLIRSIIVQWLVSFFFYLTTTKLWCPTITNENKTLETDKRKVIMYFTKNVWVKIKFCIKIYWLTSILLHRNDTVSENNVHQIYFIVSECATMFTPYKPLHRIHFDRKLHFGHILCMYLILFRVFFLSLCRRSFVQIDAHIYLFIVILFVYFFFFTHPFLAHYYGRIALCVCEYKNNQKKNCPLLPEEMHFILWYTWVVSGKKGTIK